MKNLILLILIFLPLAGFCDNILAKTYLHIGDSYFKEGKYDSARQYYEKNLLESETRKRLDLPTANEKLQIQIAKKKKEIEVVKQSQKRSTQIFYIILAGMFNTTLLISFCFWVINRKNSREVKKQLTKLEDCPSFKLQQLSKRVHDELGGDLAAIIIRIQLAKRASPNSKFGTALDESLENLRHGIENIREISRHINQFAAVL